MSSVKVIQVRFSQEEYRKLLARAERCGLGLNGFVRRSLGFPEELSLDGPELVESPFDAADSTRRKVGNLERKQ